MHSAPSRTILRSARRISAKSPKRSSKRESIVVCSAHSDDFVIGAGGTIARYAQDGHKVTALVFSYGEKSLPWFKEYVVQKIRSQEADRASKLLGCHLILFDLREGNFISDLNQDGRRERLIKIFRKLKPTKVFIHSSEDPHPDHKAVNKVFLEICPALPTSPEVYIYPVWNAISLKTLYPSLYINITDQFFLKLRALRIFQSQQIHIIYPVFLLMFRAFREGLKIHVRFAEKFFRIK